MKEQRRLIDILNVCNLLAPLIPFACLDQIRCIRLG
jgi:hypothetical protein